MEPLEEQLTGVVWVVDGEILEHSPPLIDLGNDRTRSLFQLSALQSRNGSNVSCIATIQHMNVFSKQAMLLIQGKVLYN